MNPHLRIARPVGNLERAVTMYRLGLGLLESRLRRMRIPFGVAYGTDKDQGKSAALRAARRIEGTVRDGGREPNVWLVGFGDGSLNFEPVVWVGRDLHLWSGTLNVRLDRGEPVLPR